MKSRTSFSKLTTFKKEIFRYAPVWALYLIGMLLSLLTVGGRSYYDHFAKNMPNLFLAFGVVNLIYAGMVAVMLFGDLYNTRMCYALHSLPQRRESWLLSHLSAGMLFSMAPNLLAMVYFMLQLESYWFLALYWYLAVTLQYLCFFGIATASALLTGNRFAMLAIYAIVNFLSMLVYATVQFLYIPNFTGVVANLSDFSRFCPVVHLFEGDFNFLRFESYEVLEKIGIKEYSETHYRYLGLGTGWGYSAIMGGVGLASMVIGLWLYRIRHLESAGDFLAFPKLKAPICVVLTVCAALCFALVGEAFSGDYGVWLAVGLVVGFFGSLMLLERRVKVFRKKTFLGFAILAAVTILSFCAVHQDWFGIEDWTPRADRVKSVTVANFAEKSYYPYNDRLSATLEDEAAIEEIITAHEDILSRLDEERKNSHRVVLIYKMKSGRTVVRSYYAPASGTNYNIVTKYLYTKDSVLGFVHWQDAAKTLRYMYSSRTEIPEAFYGAVLEALQKDYDAGNIVYGHNGGEQYIEYQFQSGDGYYISRVLSFSDRAENLTALMKSPKFQLGYTDWEKFLGQVHYMSLDGEYVAPQYFSGLLEAIRKDMENGTISAYGQYGSGLFMVEYNWTDDNGKEYFQMLDVGKDAENTLAWIENYLLQNGESA